MSFKKLLFSAFIFVTVICFPHIIKAVNTSYCRYGDTQLILPVTIGVEINAIDTFYPFDRIKDINVSDSLLVYDRDSCLSYLNEEYFDSKKYMVTTKYYYEYNDIRTYTDFQLGGGIYTNIDRTPPTISSGFTNYVADVGILLNTEEYSGFVTANDDVDGEIIPEIIYDNYEKNYDKIGNYSVIFRACDKSKNCEYLSTNIEVKDRIPPYIEGDTEYISYISNPINVISIVNQLSGFDNYDGEISNKITLISSSLEPTIPGTYYLKFSLKDSSNNNYDFKVSITVIDDIPPTIEGSNFYVSYLSNKLKINHILSNIVVSDNVDFSAHKNLYVVEDMYTPNQDKIGSYSIIVATYDSNKNESLPYLITIEVKDDIIPTIDGCKEYQSYLSSPLTLSRIKSDLIVLDNHDGNLINKIEVLEDTYTNNKTNLGVYHVTFIVKDNSNNTSQPFIISIITIDDIPPTIEGNTSFYSLTNEKIDVINIKLSLNANDNIDGDLTNEIILNEDTYTENYYIEGSHFLTFYVTDKSGNISNLFKVKMIVKESHDIIDNLNNSHLTFSTKTLKNDHDIFSLLNIDINNYISILPLENSYSKSYNIQGNYKIIYEVTYNDYSTKNLIINISTYDEENNEISIENQNETPNKEVKIKEKKETTLNKIVSFFKNIFNKIISFFKNLFR